MGLTLIALVLVCFQMPLVAFLGESFNKKIDPKFDITNDVYGWSELAKQFKLTAEDAQKNLPWVGSRYQTAALAAYFLKDASKVELLPRDEKSLDEWPDLRLTDSRGPEWPKIEKPFVFAADNRFSAPPEFKGGDCSKKQDFKFYRAQYLAKTITLYYCRPY